MQWHRDEFLLSNDKSRIKIDQVWDFISNRSYWAQGISKDLVAKSIKHSLCFGIYDSKNPDVQVGFGRVITDHATFAYLSDVYILESYRGRGLSKWFVENMLGHPQLQGLRRFCLATADAHSLYGRFGFEVTKKPERWMEILKPDIYKNSPEPSKSST